MMATTGAMSSLLSQWVASSWGPWSCDKRATVRGYIQLALRRSTLSRAPPDSIHGASGAATSRRTASSDRGRPRPGRDSSRACNRPRSRPPARRFAESRLI